VQSGERARSTVDRTTCVSPLTYPFSPLVWPFFLGARDTGIEDVDLVLVAMRLFPLLNRNSKV